MSNALSVFPTNKVKHDAQAENKHVAVDQPNLVRKYNESMEGVDSCDQNISLTRISISGKKWYFPLYALC